MFPRWIAVAAAGATLVAATLNAAPQAVKRDYLTDAEADQIREAKLAAPKIKLYLTFAEDRLKKFQYEISRTSPGPHRADTLNGILNSYTGCVDDAADQVEAAADEQQDIRNALKEFESKGKEFLAALEKIQRDGVEVDLYQDTLDDAMDSTHEALDTVAKAQKDSAAPPVRRKPS
jgi:hypothetical protein